MNKLYSILLLIILILVIYNSNRKTYSSTLTVANTYLYVAVSIFLLFFYLSNIEKVESRIKLDLTKYILFFIISIVCIVSMNYTNGMLSSHLIWLLFIFCIAIIVYPMYKRSEDISLTILTTSIIVTGLLIVYICQSNKLDFSSIGSYLTIALISMIIFKILDSLIFKTTSTKLKIYGIITVVLFSTFLLYDTDRLINRTKYIETINYPKESINIFLDILNILVGVTNFNR